jgi:hypothetical protein
MSIAYVVVALVTSDSAVRIFATSFAIAAMAGGPITSVQRRQGLWASSAAVAMGVLVWLVRRGPV